MTAEYIETTGTLRYGQLVAGRPAYLVLDLDDGIAQLARALIPPQYQVQGTRYPAHVSIIRHEHPPSKRLFRSWGSRQGERVAIAYSRWVYNDETYWWLNVLAPELAALRVSLGLPPSTMLTRPPDGSEFFHISVANTKHHQPARQTPRRTLAPAPGA